MSPINRINPIILTRVTLLHTHVSKFLPSKLELDTKLTVDSFPQTNVVDALLCPVSFSQYSEPWCWKPKTEGGICGTPSFAWVTR